MEIAAFSNKAPNAMMRAESIEGWMTSEELQWLHDSAATCQVVVEVGIWKGRSTMAICDGGADQVIAIDHFRGAKNNQASRLLAATQNMEAIARENLAEHLESGRLIILPVDSHDIAVAMRAYGYSGKVDMVFIDGGHDYESVSRDIATFGRLVKPNGILAGHDMTSEPGVNRAIREAFPKGVEKVAGDIWRAIL